ncbi:hypothetical protein V866_005400 [Kwoniella sp. B9012]
MVHIALSQDAKNYLHKMSISIPADAETLFVMGQVLHTIFVEQKVQVYMYSDWKLATPRICIEDRHKAIFAVHGLIHTRVAASDLDHYLLTYPPDDKNWYISKIAVASVLEWTYRYGAARAAAGPDGVVEMAWTQGDGALTTGRVLLPESMKKTLVQEQYRIWQTWSTKARKRSQRETILAIDGEATIWSGTLAGRRRIRPIFEFVPKWAPDSLAKGEDPNWKQIMDPKYLTDLVYRNTHIDMLKKAVKEEEEAAKKEKQVDEASKKDAEKAEDNKGKKKREKKKAKQEVEDSAKAKKDQSLPLKAKPVNTTHATRGSASVSNPAVPSSQPTTTPSGSTNQASSSRPRPTQSKPRQGKRKRNVKDEDSDSEWTPN